MTSFLASICAWWVALIHQVLSLVGVRCAPSQKYQRLNSQPKDNHDLEKNAVEISPEQPPLLLQQQQQFSNTQWNKLDYTTKPKIATTTVSEIPTPTDDETKNKKELNFLDLVKIAREKVQAKWPKAQLYSAKSQTSDPKGVDTCRDLTSMTVLFRLVDQGIVSIETTTTKSDDSDSSIFDDPKFIPGPVLGNKDIDWPPVYTAEEAEQVLRETGFKLNFKSLILRKPGDPTMNRNYYVFDMVDGQDAWIPSDGGID